MARFLTVNLFGMTDLAAFSRLIKSHLERLRVFATSCLIESAEYDYEYEYEHDCPYTLHPKPYTLK